jgi:hypothetical protein
MKVLQCSKNNGNNNNGEYWRSSNKIAMAVMTVMK